VHETITAPTAVRAVLFVRALRLSGAWVTLGQELDFLRALADVDLALSAHGSSRRLFHAARALLVTRREDQALFAELFERIWGAGAPVAARGQKAPRAPRHDAAATLRYRLESLLARSAKPSDREAHVSDRALTWSDVELLATKDFATMSDEELAAARRVIEEMAWGIAERRTRRFVPARRGRRFDLRRALRQAARHGGRVVEPPRRRPRTRPRPLVLIADVSGSMERYSRLALLFFHAVSRHLPHTESFVFGTRLTRVTHRLRLRDPDRALEEAGAEVVDWAGGTRIGESLATFNRRWARRVLRRGAVVVILSDGWERGDAALLRREMRALRDRCHRLVWLNPRLGYAGYQPLVEGMAAALPLCDDFLTIHDLQSLAQLADHLENLPRRRSARRSLVGEAVLEVATAP
jgi:uncharacterized protein with von Willebrand factor type A (vWA) domain